MYTLPTNLPSFLIPHCAISTWEEYEAWLIKNKVKSHFQVWKDEQEKARHVIWWSNYVIELVTNSELLALIKDFLVNDISMPIHADGFYAYLNWRGGHNIKISKLPHWLFDLLVQCVQNPTIIPGVVAEHQNIQAHNSPHALAQWLDSIHSNNPYHITLVTYMNDVRPGKYNTLYSGARSYSTSAAANSSGGSEPQYIPWHNTQSLARGIAGLNRMYESLSFDDPLKSFIDGHCSHLLSSLEGHTGIPVELSSPTNLDNYAHTIDLPAEYSDLLLRSLPGHLGVYVFYLPGEEKVTRCGSSIQFENRMHNHYIDSTKNKGFFDNTNIHDYKWSVVKFGIDYGQMFGRTHAMTSEQEDILRFFTQQEIRSIEQSYSTYALPTTYNRTEVNTWHSNWFKGMAPNNGQGKKVTWIDELGNIHVRNSTETAAKDLGITRKYLKIIAAQEERKLFTSHFGNVTISVEGINKVDMPFDKRYSTPVNTGVDTSQLEGNKLYVYDLDMDMLPYGPFTSAKELNIAMGLSPEYGGTYLWCNYVHSIYSPSLGQSIYVVKRIVDTATPMIAKCVEDGTTIEFPSGSALQRHFVTYSTGLKPYILRRIIDGTPYQSKKYGKSYILSFKNPEHLDDAIIRLSRIEESKFASSRS